MLAAKGLACYSLIRTILVVDRCSRLRQMPPLQDFRSLPHIVAIYRAPWKCPHACTFMKLKSSPLKHIATTSLQLETGHPSSTKYRGSTAVPASHRPLSPGSCPLACKSPSDHHQVTTPIQRVSTLPRPPFHSSCPPVRSSSTAKPHLNPNPTPPYSQPRSLLTPSIAAEP